MSFVYLAIIVLIPFGVLNIIVGISNDSVNFLNSAIGSAVAKRKTVFIISSAGIVLGTLISTGMMDIARNGIIYPEKFYLTELLTLFIAAMIINIILIDLFNTFKFPTSTTIAVVFELIGGTLAIALIKHYETNITGLPVSEIINTNNIFLILSGIVFSIILSFVAGMIVQFITRLIFSFNYRNKYKILFSVFGGLAITAISFMLFKKSVNGIFIREDVWQQMVESSLPEILITIFAGSAFIFLFLSLSFDFDISRLVVLFGTFALALSFAANDLVNFIGLPLTGIESIKRFFDTSSLNPDTFSLDFLNDELLQKEMFQDITQLIIFLVVSGIMIITLFYSRKAEGVTETEVFLGRQHPGNERFEPLSLARLIVSTVLKNHTFMTVIFPPPVLRFIKSRYKYRNDIGSIGQTNEIMYFDTLRAIVNLTMAGLLISAGTYFRMPLSTTFVVFMVAMGTSLADMAWGRENAVYRVSGVLYILGGWFLTAVLAFMGSFIITFLIWYGKTLSILFLTILLFYILCKTTKHYRKTTEKAAELNKKTGLGIPSFEHIFTTGKYSIKSLLIESSKIYFLSLKAFINEDLSSLHKTVKNAEVLSAKLKRSKSEIFEMMINSPDKSLPAGNEIIQAFDHLSEMINNITQISLALYKHLKNQNKGFTKSQKIDLNLLLEDTSSFFNYLIHIGKEQRFDSLSELTKKQGIILSHIEELRIKQLKKIKKGSGTIKSNMLFIETLAETKNWLLYSINFTNTLNRFASFQTHKGLKN